MRPIYDGLEMTENRCRSYINYQMKNKSVFTVEEHSVFQYKQP